MEEYGKLVYSTDNLIVKRMKNDRKFNRRVRAMSKKLRLPRDVVIAILPENAEEFAYLSDNVREIDTELAEALWEYNRGAMCFGLLGLFSVASLEMRNAILELGPEHLEKILVFLIYGADALKTS